MMCSHKFGAYSLWYSINKGFTILVAGIWSLFCVCGCQDHHGEVDRLNELSYDYHYRNLDSTRVYAERALRKADSYDAGRAEALNNLAFVSMARMDYDRVTTLIGQLNHVTDNQVELLVADVQLMRLCQRESHNKDFYTYRERAIRRMRRIDEERDLLNAHQRRRMAYAYSEFYIVASVYFYYVGLADQSREELSRLANSDYLEQDTVQLLNYLYNVGSGGIIQAPTTAQVYQEEFEQLIRCYLLACQQHIPFFEAQSMQGLSEHLRTASMRRRLIADNPPAIDILNVDDMPDSLLAGNLALRALHLFQQYGDVYQISGSYRTLAECYWELHDYRSSLICLQQILTADTVIQRAPDLVASIREQLSLAYSAIDDKPNSDYNRNIYLDMQEQTRQDRQLEARAEQLGKSSEQLNIMIAAIIFLIAFAVTLLVVLDIKRRRNDRRMSVDRLLEPLRQWKTLNEQHIASQEEEHEEIAEQTQLAQLHLQQNRERYLEQRAKLALVTSITPFIDRILHEVQMLRRDDGSTAGKAVRQERIAYITELTDKINDYNAVLTDWIRLRQGEIHLHIESFALQGLFDIVAKGKMGFRLKGLTLIVKPTDAVVKADRTLTLFMLNTLADNARKFTPSGGTVTIEAEGYASYVEISISDTGIGMSEEQMAHIFDHKPISDTQDNIQEGKSHGFGLMNCKGIIEKYKKISQVFAPCAIGAESQGNGSRFWFRLPRGIVRLLLVLLAVGYGNQTHADSCQQKSQRYADSTYYYNIAGRYHRTLQMADSCVYYLNRHYVELVHGRGSHDTMSLYDARHVEPAELRWFRRGVRADYAVILNMRNEVAVAALALHKWSLYGYNNKAYTQLFRERSADTTLGNYVRVMQKSETNKNVAIILLVLLLILLFPAYYFFYYRYRLMYRFCLERIQQINQVLLSDSTPQDKLQHIHDLWDSRRLLFDHRFDVLESLVSQIGSALRQQIRFDKQQRNSIELERDELNRRQYENGRLHISNSVLDNCLSTLKHETMYYPSRIRQLVDARPLDQQALEEVVAYYKALYSILSAQAMRQTEGAIRIDRAMWLLLIEVLKSHNGGAVTWTVLRRDAHYIIVTVPLPGLSLTPVQCRQLFTPATVDVRFLLCRQIIRELGENTHARACGIEAVPAEQGIVVNMVVPAGTAFFTEVHQNPHGKAGNNHEN